MSNRGEWTKYITPVLMTIALFMLGEVMAQIGRVEEKLFHHLSNDEIHMPRGQFVTKAEFDLQGRFAEKETERILKAIDELKDDLKKDGR